MLPFMDALMGSQPPVSQNSAGSILVLTAADSAAPSGVADFVL